MRYSLKCPFFPSSAQQLHLCPMRQVVGRVGGAEGTSAGGKAVLSLPGSENPAFCFQAPWLLAHSPGAPSICIPWVHEAKWASSTCLLREAWPLFSSYKLLPFHSGQWEPDLPSTKECFLWDASIQRAAGSRIWGKQCPSCCSQASICSLSSLQTFVPANVHPTFSTPLPSACCQILPTTPVFLLLLPNAWGSHQTTSARETRMQLVWSSS